MRGHSSLTLDVLEVDARKGRGRFASAPASNVKCVARTCKFNGLNMNNKMAVGVCSKCSCFEHFECSRTQQEDRDLILKGEQNYFCSMCFMKNPTMVAFKLNKAPNTPKQNQITATAKATHLAIETLVMFKCEVCNFETSDQEIFKNHQNEAHGCM